MKTGIFKIAKALHLTFIVILIWLSSHMGFAEPITEDKAGNLSENFLTYLNASHTIDKIEHLTYSDQTVGYLIRLSPQGYILVAADTIRVPIKAYSFTSDFDHLPPAYTQTLVKELFIPLSESVTGAIKSTKNSSGVKTVQDTALEEINHAYWSFLTDYTSSAMKLTRSYIPDTFLLTTTWNQGYPYNKFNPLVNDQLTLTGCTQTAIAQIMRYNFHPEFGSGVFTHIWNQQTLTAVMNRPFNWDIMPDIVNGNVETYQQDEVAALMRDLGILNEADFGVTETSASFNKNAFARAFGYASIYQMESDDPEFFTTIANEIDNEHPVLLSIPGHMTVADGYASDGTGKKIHLNMGWGGTSDDYYYLDQTIVTENYTFSPNHTIYYNIRPCEGNECNPYSLEPGANDPVISSDLPDLIMEDNITIRIEAYDPDGDTVSLSATSSCGEISPLLDNNLLRLSSTDSDILCEIKLAANTDDGNAEKNFNVLVLNKSFFMGTSYDIDGSFSDQEEIDEHKAYLQGQVSIKGDRGYSNQAFYLWVKDDNDNVVIDVSDQSISGNLAPGFYYICASISDPFSGWHYTYDSGFSGYTISVMDTELNTSVESIANELGIDLTQFNENDLAISVESMDNTGIVPFEAQFFCTVNSGNPPYEYQWDFGDSGIGSTNENPSYIYENAGSYMATCRVTDAGGQSTSQSVIMQLNDRVIVLTDSSPNCVVYSGNEITIYGTSGTNQITIEKGANANLMNFPGSNQIIVKGESGQFDITRSGAAVRFQDNNNSTYLKIPATSTSQTIQFNDGTKILRIDNSQVTLGGIVVE